MEKRAVKRIPKCICIKFFSGTSLHSGIIINLSEKGICINTKMPFPLKSKLEIHLPLKKEILKVHGMIKNIRKAGKIYNGIGVELLNPTENYLKLIRNLKTSYYS